MLSSTVAPQSEQKRALVAATLRVPRQTVPATEGAESGAGGSRRAGAAPAEGASVVLVGAGRRSFACGGEGSVCVASAGALSTGIEAAGSAAPVCGAGDIQFGRQPEK